MTRIPSPDRAAAPHGGPEHPAPCWSLGTAPWQEIPAPTGTRLRVILDNDFSGDPDDLYQLVHHLLSPSTDVRAIVASHLREGDPFDPGPDSARNAAAVARDVLARMALDASDLVLEGSNDPLADVRTPQDTPAARAIIAEALREDDRPLLYLAGGGLTDVASALLLEPAIAERMTLVWIGGNEHEGLAVPPPNAMPIEYNLLIDPVAGQAVFGGTEVPIWQIPRDIYRQCLVSEAELRRRVAATGAIGRYLYDETAQVLQRAASFGAGPAETYALGDSPLVLLSTLQSVFEPDSSSSRHVVRPTPAIADDGSYQPRPDARPMRIYTFVDTRLMFEDMFLKLAEFDVWLTAQGERA